MSVLTPDEVLETALSDLPEGSVLTSALVIVEYSMPGEDDPEMVGPYLAWKRSTSGVWRFLGQLDLVKDAMLTDLRGDR